MILKKLLNFSKPQNDDDNDIYLSGVVFGKSKETMHANCIDH